MSFESLKQKRKNIQSLTEELNKFDAPKNRKTEDDRFWTPTKDKAGNGYAVIRFLPSLEEEDLTIPFVKTYDHGFQGPSGRWYIENSLRTIDKDDPVLEFNSKLWNGSESDKEQARKQKSRLHYIGNILVIKDPTNPENEGKVKLFKFGAKIFAKIKDAMQPQFEDETPIVPYDLWEGANFKLKIRKVEGYPNYDTSSFDEVSPLFEDDSEIEAVYNKLNRLLPFIDPDGKDIDGQPYFKPYAELKAKLYKVLDLNDSENSTVPVSHSKSTDEKRVVQKEETVKVEDLPFDTDAESDDEDLEFFKKLAQQ
jgi:gp32 DNA binding protein like